ncbi:hypothetical protein ABEQ76_05520 [Bacillus velezensis]
MLWIILTLIILFSLGFFLMGTSIDHQNLRKKTLDKITGESFSRIYTSTDYSTKLFFDEDAKKIKIVYISLDDLKNTDINPLIKTYNFKDIVDVEIIIDGKAISKVSKGEAFLGASVGGALAGSVGAIVGGGTASSSTKEYVKSIHLRLCVEDYDYPYYDIAFFTGAFYDPDLKTASKKSDPEVQKAFKEIENWFRYFKLAIRETEKVAH